MDTEELVKLTASAWDNTVRAQEAEDVAQTCRDAIRTERERCAQIADRWAKELWIDDKMHAGSAASVIAREIRKG